MNGDDAVNKVSSPAQVAFLARTFADTASSYKFFWLIGLLKLLQDGDRLSVTAVVEEMVVTAWYPVVLYRLSLGHHDRLQNLLLDLAAHSGLPGQAREQDVRQALKGWDEARGRLENLGRYVPTRFLAPWFADALEPSMRDDRRTRAIIELAARRVFDGASAPYSLSFGRLGETELSMDPVWRSWLMDASPVVRGLAERKLSQFLQARNPNAPGIPGKLGPPPIRDLGPARRFFATAAKHGVTLIDIFTDAPLDVTFSVDHFLPRCFLAHDLIWNLAPATPQTNRAKSDSVPDLRYIPPLARLHHQLVRSDCATARIAEDYVAALRTDFSTLRTASDQNFIERYLDLYRPLTQIAANQGFACGWSPSPPSNTLVEPALRQG
ncbi:HNH endonuclease domain-containing protein [Mesorhizobium sp.]|uniref:HNH endonuclease domain-containing protein n=1 Tax=Mesorhizobium sp. TaxID=1871066 RepID=UPI0011F4B38A|nr:HNH endonuclease domain-containing protein [Mesorhizobium sp.]TIL65600.1 MAG: hypothetical protein E5Y77_20665 [Mesorhizobium sp.]